MEFSRFGKRAEDAAPKGSSFLTETKDRLHEVFQSCLERGGDFPTVEKWAAALEADVWTLMEQVSKQSWHNGIARGQERRRPSPR
jgi:hypothetical protein